MCDQYGDRANVRAGTRAGTQTSATGQTEIHINFYFQPLPIYMHLATPTSWLMVSQ